MMGPKLPPLVGDAYETATLCVEFILAGKYKDVQAVLEALDGSRRNAVLGASLLLTAEILRDTTHDDDKALAMLHAIRKAAKARS